MPNPAVVIPDTIRRILHIDPLKYSLSDTERAALRAYQEILKITNNEDTAKELFNSAWNKDPNRAGVKLDNVINKITPKNISTKKEYYIEKAKHSDIASRIWYKARAFGSSIRDGFTKEPRKPNVTKETKLSWIDSLAEKKILGMSAARVCGYFAFALTLLGVAAACLVTAGMIAPFGIISVAGAASTLIGTSVGIVSGEASDKHDGNKIMKDNRIMIADAYKVNEAAKSCSTATVQQESRDNLITLLDRTMTHLHKKQIEGNTILPVEKAMFGLKIACSALAALSPIASGINFLGGGGIVKGGVLETARLTSVASSVVSAANNGTLLAHKQAKHNTNTQTEESFKNRISKNTVDHARKISKEITLEKKTQRWCDRAKTTHTNTFAERVTQTPTAGRAR